MIDSPTVLLISLGFPYINYIKEIPNTFNYKYYMPLISTSKTSLWDSNLDMIDAATIRVIYSSLLELFIKDNTTEMFYFIFKDYVKKIVEGNDDSLYRDGSFNSIFHYDAIHGESRLSEYSKISRLYNEDLKNEIGIDTEIFNIDLVFDKNVNNIRVLDVIKFNS